MRALRGETLPIHCPEDVARARQAVRVWSSELAFSLVDQTRIVTAASELARNTLDHGGGGTMRVEIVENGSRRGLQLVFEDRGPGIPDVELALMDGYTTANGLGLGLSGARRLSDDFEIVSKVGEGTRVRIARWK